MRAVLISGGAGYIGSHVAHALKTAGFFPVVIDSLVSGHRWAAEKAGAFRQGDIGDREFVGAVCAEFRPAAALHFAAFIEVGESVADPQKYFVNNRDKAKIFFDAMAEAGVTKIVFSSTAAVYGEAGEGLIGEDHPTRPINPYGQSKLEAETYLRTVRGASSATLRYFNVAGAAPEAGLGEAHYPETHLIPRLVLPLIEAPAAVQQALGLGQGFRIFGTDHATRDGTAVRDYIHVMDLAEAHLKALDYLLAGGANAIFNLGSGAGYSVKDIVQAARQVLDRPDFNPGTGPRRPGDAASLIAGSARARTVLGWTPRRDIAAMIRSAAAWHRSATYVETILTKAGLAIPPPV